MSEDDRTFGTEGRIEFSKKDKKKGVQENKKKDIFKIIIGNSTEKSPWVRKTIFNAHMDKAQV